MSELKQELESSLEEAKKSGKLHADRLKQIVKEAVSEALSETRSGSVEIISIARTAISTVTETLQDRGTELKEDFTASIEGIIEAIRSRKNRPDENPDTPEVDTLLDELHDSEPDPRKRLTLNEAIEELKQREEIARLQEHYARLKSQLALVQANLAENYGHGQEEIQKHLDEAREWYEKAKESPEFFTDKVRSNHQNFEEKLGNIGTAVARKEQQIKHQLKELLQSAIDILEKGKRKL